MIIYDTFIKKSVEVNKTSEFLKSYGLHSRDNCNTFNAFRARTKFCLHRFIKEEYKNKIFYMYCLDTNIEYECVSSNGFLIQIGSDINKDIIHEINRLRSGGRSTILINGLLYCLSKNKENLSNHSLCSGYYKEIASSYNDLKNTQSIQRKISNNLRDRIRSAVNRKSQATMELTGCSIQFLMGWLENQFQEGMSWDNRSKWHIDHIIPCASFDLTIEENQRKCFHYTNLQPLWAIDNIRKGASVT